MAFDRNAYQREYRRANAAKVNKSNAEWRRRNPDKEKAMKAKWRAAHRERIQQQQQAYRAKHGQRLKEMRFFKVYGLTPESLERMWNTQGGACDICRNALTRDSHTPTSVHVDHCHETGVVRGLLCSACNLALGQFRDSPKLLEAAIAYLRKPRGK